jgi:hypothetical protein
MTNEELMAEAENWQGRYSARDKGDILIGALVDALRTAETEKSKLREALSEIERASGYGELAKLIARRALGGEL